jgi:hypothetical protein
VLTGCGLCGLASLGSPAADLRPAPFSSQTRLARNQARSSPPTSFDNEQCCPEWLCSSMPWPLKLASMYQPDPAYQLGRGILRPPIRLPLDSLYSLKYLHSSSHQMLSCPAKDDDHAVVCTRPWWAPKTQVMNEPFYTSAVCIRHRLEKRHIAE